MNFFGPYALLAKIIGVGAVLMAAFVAGSTWTGRAYKAEIAQMVAAHATAVADAQAAARAREQELQDAANAAEAKYAKEIKDIRSRAARAESAGQRLRDELAAAGRRPEDAGAGARVNDPAFLRELLVDLDAVAGVLASRSEECRAQLRGLQGFVEAAVRGRR